MIRQTSTKLSFNDIQGTMMARLSFNRNDYKTEPGLYAVNNPDKESVVFVSANYKLSFDTLRKNLAGMNAWILVIDTKGINVWCAAGKGTFGTDEIVNRIAVTNLKDIVNHRKIIVPQLGGPGTSAHEVKKLSGFTVVYGPARAEDIPRFVSNGMKTDPTMREVRFGFVDRLILTPVEFVDGLYYLVMITAILFVLSGFNKTGYSVALARTNGIAIAVNLILTYVAGTIIGPLLLPWLPGHAFAFKGAVAGLIMYGISYATGFAGNNPIDIIAWLLLMPSISSYMLMNFTGATTYTSLSGVKKEMKLAVPLQFIGAVLGLILWIIDRFI
jgi:hypothetical protein